MTTYSKETALYNTGAISTDIEEAGQTAERYITQVDSDGIKVHAQNNPTTNYSLINASGLTVYKGGNDVATFGDTARVGKSNSSRFVINASSLQAYNSSNTKYFEVSASGLTYGSNTAATTADLTAETNRATAAEGEAAKTASNYLTPDSTTGIKVHAQSNPTTNYSLINASGLTVYKGGNDVATFGDTARVGKSNSSRFLMNASSLQAYNSSNTKYFEVSASGLTYGSNTAATTEALSAETTRATAAEGEAAKTASRFISVVDSEGITVHAQDNSTTNYSLINEDGLTVYKGGDDVAVFSDTARVGPEDSGHVTIDEDSVDFSDGQNTIASFGGENVQIGADDSARVIMTPSKTEMLTSYGAAYFSAAETGGGTAPVYEEYVLASNKTATNSYGHPQTMIICQGVGSVPLSFLSNGETFIVGLIINHYHKNKTGSPSSYTKILSGRTIGQTFTKGTSASYNAPTYSISQHPDYFSYKTLISYDSTSSTVTISLYDFERGSSAPSNYDYRIELEVATIAMTVTKELPLIKLGGKVETLNSIYAGEALFANGAEFSRPSSNHVVIGGYHVCWGSLSIGSPTLNAYAEQTVTLPYTYTSTPFCIASCAGRAARHRTAYASQGDQTGNKIRVGYYATASGTIYINYLTIGV